MHRRPLPILLFLAALLAGCADSGGPDDGEGAGDGTGTPTGQAQEPGHAIQAGAVNAAVSANVHAFAVDGAHGRLAVALVMLQGGSGSLAMNVTGPSQQWERVTTGPFLYVFPGTRSTASFADPEEGPWEATVQGTGTSVLVRYEVHFCADSAERPGPQDNVACHRDY